MGSRKWGKKKEIQCYSSVQSNRKSSVVSAIRHSTTALIVLNYFRTDNGLLKKFESNYQNYHAALAGAGHTPETTIPVMRTVFVADNDKLAATVRAKLERSVPPRMRQAGVGVD